MTNMMRRAVLSVLVVGLIAPLSLSLADSVGVLVLDRQTRRDLMLVIDASDPYANKSVDAVARSPAAELMIKANRLSELESAVARLKSKLASANVEVVP